MEEDKKKLRVEILEMMRELKQKRKSNETLSINVAHRDSFDAERFLHEHPEHESMIKKVIKTEYFVAKKDLKRLEKSNPALFHEYNKRNEYLTMK